MGAYVKKTARRRYDERQFTIRAVHRDPPDPHKLCEALIRLAPQEAGQSRGHRGDQEALDAHGLPRSLTRGAGLPSRAARAAPPLRVDRRH